MKLIDDWKRTLEKRGHVGAVLMDLSKAVDCFPHQLLVAKKHTEFAENPVHSSGRIYPVESSECASEARPVSGYSSKREFRRGRF